MVELNPQVHIEPHKSLNGRGIFSEYVSMDSYDADGPTSLAMVTVHGSNMDDHDVTVELWLTADEIVAIRDGLNQLIKEDA